MASTTTTTTDEHRQHLKEINPEFWKSFAKSHVKPSGHVETTLAEEVGEVEEHKKEATPSSGAHVLKWNQFLSNVRVSEIMLKPGEIIKVSTTDTVKHALDQFERNHISSLPIQNAETQQWVGTLSLLDVMVYFIGTGHYTLDLSVQDIMNLSFRNPPRTVDFQTSALVAMDLLSLRNVHRLLVTGIPASLGAPLPLAGFITQTSLAEWLSRAAAEHLPASALAIKVRYFRGWICKPVSTVPADKPLRLALETLWHERISGVAVVNAEGALVGTISGSDFKYCDLSDAAAFKASLARPISEIIAVQAADYKADHPFFWSHLHQYTCTLDDSLAQVLAKLCTHRIHRVWVIDFITNKPIGVISLGDIIAELEYI